MSGAARLSQIKIALKVFFTQFHAWGATINNA
jgi:hypothetical protein